MALTPALTRIRNNQVYNSDIYADAKVVTKSISGGLLSDNFTYTGNC
jgi:ribonuclease HI